MVTFDLCTLTRLAASALMVFRQLTLRRATDVV
jgi:hypothetical protein